MSGKTNRKILAVSGDWVDTVALEYLIEDLQERGFTVDVKPCPGMDGWKTAREELTGHRSEYAAAITRHAFGFHMGSLQYPEFYPPIESHLNELRELIGGKPVILYEDLGGLSREVCGELKAKGFHGIDWMITPKNALKPILDIINTRPSTKPPVWLGMDLA